MSFKYEITGAKLISLLRTHNTVAFRSRSGSRYKLIVNNTTVEVQLSAGSVKVLHDDIPECWASIKNAVLRINILAN